MMAWIVAGGHVVRSIPASHIPFPTSHISYPSSVIRNLVLYPVMNPSELIRKKRDGGSLSRAELEALIGGFLAGTVADYQMAAFLMAVYFRGMGPEETLTFMDVMLHSGTVIDLSSIPGRKVDKHSTGGVGDKVSLILAPMVAACGVPVPMISGRGLGHTGGTLDKLESIPGFRTDLSVEEYRRIIAATGVVLSGQTKEVAPADKKMYALRDVTATIESVPLIAGSIMSKKLAEGIDALVLDVKTGEGAFMENYESAVALAEALVSIGNGVGRETIAFLTSMDQPLGTMIGNWCEIVEAVECLRGKNVQDLMEVTYVLGGAMTFLGGKAASIEEGMKLCRSAIWSGRAYEKFLQSVSLQGGDVSLVEHPERYERPAFTSEVRSSREGVVSGFRTKRIGMLAVGLGAGRRKVGDRIDPKAGIHLLKKLGDPVRKDEVVAILFADREDAVERGVSEFQSCVEVGDVVAHHPPAVRAYVDREGLKPWSTPRLF